MGGNHIPLFPWPVCSLPLTRTVLKCDGIIHLCESLCLRLAWMASTISKCFRLLLFVNFIEWYTGMQLKGRNMFSPWYRVTHPGCMSLRTPAMKSPSVSGKSTVPYTSMISHNVSALTDGFWAILSYWAGTHGGLIGVWDARLFWSPCCLQLTNWLCRSIFSLHSNHIIIWKYSSLWLVVQ